MFEKQGGIPVGLRTYAQRLARGWRDFTAWRPISRLLPFERVLLNRRNGEQAVVRMPGFDVRAYASVAQPAYVAVEIAEGSFLERRLELPLASDDDLNEAVRLEVEAVSPFPAGEVVYGWRRVRDEGHDCAVIAISSKRFVQGSLARLEGVRGFDGIPEVWASTSVGYVVLHGYGEVRREAQHGRGMKQLAFAFVAATVATIVLALTPLMEKREQAVQAQRQLAGLLREAAPVVASRDELIAVQALRNELKPRTEGGVDLATVLDGISRALPDGAWLDLFEYNPGSLRIGGRADDAAGLIQALQELRIFANVHAPSPIVREPQTGKERFLIEMELLQ